MEHNDVSINELPFEILMEIFEYFSISEIARFPMTCTHWRDLMQQDHFWASLARKTYGQYVGETPTKKQLEELSKRCGQELTFMHWLQYRSLFGLTMNTAVHISASVPDEVFDYKVTLEPGLNTVEIPKLDLYYGSAIHGGLRALSWNSTFNLVITPESGELIRKEIPLISIGDMSVHDQIRQRGKVYKYKLKLTKLMLSEFFSNRYYWGYTIDINQQLDVLQDSTHRLLPDLKMKIARVGFKSHCFKDVFRYENPFLYPPTCIVPYAYGTGTSANFCYQDLNVVHEYIPIIVKNFNDTIKSQMQLYLAEIVCGFELLHEKGLYLADSIPVIKKDGHLQFIYAGPRQLQNYSYFGLPPEKDRHLQQIGLKPSALCTPFQTDCYALGIFLLEVCSGEVLYKQVKQVTAVSVPGGLPVEIRMMISNLLNKDGKERPKTLAAIKKEPYFKGIDWQKMRKQQWSPKFLPNLE